MDGGGGDGWGGVILVLVESVCLGWGGLVQHVAFIVIVGVVSAYAWCCAYKHVGKNI